MNKNKIPRYMVIFLSLFYACKAQNRRDELKAKKLNNEVSDSLINWSMYKRDVTELKFDNALKKINEAIFLDKENTAIYSTKISLLKQFNRKKEIIDTYDTLLLVKPKLGEAYFEKGLINEEFNEFDSAVVSYKRAKSIFEMRTEDSSDYRKLSIIQLEYLINRNKEQLNKELNNLNLNDPAIISIRNNMMGSISKHSKDVGYKYIFGQSDDSALTDKKYPYRTE